MCYRLLIRMNGQWKAVGFDHATHDEAREAAMVEWSGYPFLIIPD